MYLAGNQFMVMEELIRDFQEKNPDIKTIFVETIPPGQILKGQLLKQEGRDPGSEDRHDLRVNLGHLKKVKKIAVKWAIGIQNRPSGWGATHAVPVANNIKPSAATT